MCEQFEVFESTQLPRIEWIVPHFHGNGINLRSGGLMFFKFVACVTLRNMAPFKGGSTLFSGVLICDILWFRSFLALM